jgi:hypothetical protein
MPLDFEAALGAKGFEGSFAFDVVVDPGSHAATTAVNTTVTVPAGAELQASDEIIAVPPATLEAAIVVQSCRYVSATTFTLRTGNPSAGIVDPASGTWTFIVLRK